MTEQITIRNRMNLYLAQTPSQIINIDEDCQEFLINFSLQNINLRGIYHIDTHSIENIEYIIKKPDMEKTLLITRAETDEPLAFPLQEEYKETLAYISNNAKSYLGLFNKTLYEQYQMLLNTRR